MPQGSHIVGVNSVTNIEPGRGVMPAPVFRNADWLEKFVHRRMADRLVCRQVMSQSPDGACYADSILVPCLIQDSGKWPIY